MHYFNLSKHPYPPQWGAFIIPARIGNLYKVYLNFISFFPRLATVYSFAVIINAPGIKVNYSGLE